MVFLYGIVIRIYSLLIRIASLFNAKAGLWIKGRRSWKRRAAQFIDPRDKNIWIHCASVGEFEQGRPLIEAIRSTYPQFKIILTFFSPSGYELRKDYDQVDHVMYLPLDTRKNATDLVSLINPQLVIFVKYEYWFNFIDQVSKRDIPMFIVSAIFRKRQHFFRWYGGWFTRQLKKINWFFVQNEKSAELLGSIGVKNVSVTGDTRFDRVAKIAREQKEFPLIESFIDGKPVFLAGSTWPPDEDIIQPVIEKFETKLKFVFAPHEVEPARIDEMIGKVKGKCVRYSQINEKNIRDAGILIIDSIGILSYLYRYATLAYIGGGFGAGIHNILEAVTFGKPVFFGPRYEKFQEAVDLVQLGGAYPVEDGDQLLMKVEEFVNNTNLYKEVSSICKSFVDVRQGATKTILNKINDLNLA